MKARPCGGTFCTLAGLGNVSRIISNVGNRSSNIGNYIGPDCRDLFSKWCFQDWKLHWGFFSNIGNGVSKIGKVMGTVIPLLANVFPSLEIYNPNIGNGISN